MQKPGPAPRAVIDALAVSGPPVDFAFAVILANGSGSFAPLVCTAAPSFHSTSDTSTLHIFAARSRSFVTIARQASTTAQPVA